MKHAFLAKRIALSTLLISAVATPSYFASAATGPMVKQYVTKMEQVHSPFALVTEISAMTPSNEIATVSATKIIDPLEVATKYAPDTVTDWKFTLAAYEKALSENVAKFETTVRSVDSVEAIPLKAVESIPATQLESIAIRSTDLKQSEGVLNIAVTSVAGLSITGNGFFQANIALDEAVQSENAATIKEALANLHQAYKQQTLDLQAGQK
ncbi:hypothetical protein [Cohnella mopanensis]|uniref:hypothetical protein n=1 Tax=Cohnella mopanensis TaxID=2911966 RepID=UPI001EF987E3|nr:hypothetical protein [Cohnella mopanensis]